MKILSVSLFGFTFLTLVHAAYLPVTDDDPVNTPPESNPVSSEDLLVTDDYPVNTPPPESKPTLSEEGDNPYGFSCPKGWTMHSTQCLLFVPQNLTWDEAEKNCESKGQGSLACVYSDTQAYEIYQEMKTAGLHDVQVWVGGSKTSADRSWSWVDSFIMDGFAEFCRGESAHHENNCLQITFDEKGSGCLDDLQCDMGLPSVCGFLLY